MCQQVREDLTQILQLHPERRPPPAVANARCFTAKLGADTEEDVPHPGHLAVGAHVGHCQCGRPEVQGVLQQSRASSGRRWRHPHWF